MRKLTAHRWRLSLIMLVAIVFALGTFWLVQVVNQSGQQAQQDQHRNEPDYIIERFSYVRMNKAGQPAYIIAGDKLTHRPVDDSSEIERPTMHSLAGSQPPMHMRADTAHIDQDNTRIQLRGKVEVLRPATPGNQALRLATPALTVLPDEDRMETDQPVEMKLGASTASGTGLTANNATRQIKLGGRGQIVMPPGGAQ